MVHPGGNFQFAARVNHIFFMTTYSLKNNMNRCILNQIQKQIIVYHFRY